MRSDNKKARKTKKEELMYTWLSLKLVPELRDLILAEAARATIEENRPVPMIDIAVRVLANHYGRPDLGIVPRVSYGRPPRKPKLPAEAAV